MNECMNKCCLGATALPRMTAPTAEELGMADSVYIDELGDTEIVVFKYVSYHYVILI